MGPAISLSKVEQTAPALVSLYKTAGVSLQKHGLSGARPRSISSSITPAR